MLSNTMIKTQLSIVITFHLWKENQFQSSSRVSCLKLDEGLYHILTNKNTYFWK